MSKRGIGLLLASFFIAVLCAGIFALCYWLPYLRAGSAMPSDGSFVIQQQEDRSLLLTWTEGKNVDLYQVEITRSNEDGTTTRLYHTEVTENSCLIPPGYVTGECNIQVSSIISYTTAGVTQQRTGETILEVTANLDLPNVTDLSWSLDDKTGVLTASFSLSSEATCAVCLVEDGEAAEILAVLENGKFTITIGEDGDLPMPERGSSYVLGFMVTRTYDGLQFNGVISATLEITRNDLLGSDLNVLCVDEGSNVFTFIWEETKGESYEVQLYNTKKDTWTTEFTMSANTADDLTYTTGQLDRFSEFVYRVVAVDENGSYIAVSEEITCTTGATAVYCTVWPVTALTAYRDADKSESVGTVTTLQAYCVLEETNGMFGIWFNDTVCYIDSNYCMINLTEYLGTLCLYDITNSYSSLFMVHDFEIPSVTGTTIVGYEDVLLYDGSFVVPLMYPTAQKLLTVAQSVSNQGYQLKIYESYRPGTASTTVYSTLNALLDTTVPARTYTGSSISELNLPSLDLSELTYRDVIFACGTYPLSYFIAQVSNHNMGIALDLTLVDASTGIELEMQTSIHDLSSYSALSENNSNVSKLANAMTAAGFSTLTSEWWHFNDLTTKAKYSSTALTDGVSIEGWAADSGGMKYRTADGRYYSDCTVTISGKSYTFDASGYLQS